MTGKSALKNNKGKPLNVMFGDFCYYNRHTLFARYTPLAIGQIAQYTKQEFDKDVFTRLKNKKGDKRFWKLVSDEYVKYLKLKTDMSFKHVFDVGTYYGTFIKSLTDIGIDAEGIEANQNLVRLGVTDKIKHGYFDTNYKSGKKYDLISLTQMLYYLPDSFSILKKCHEMLTDDGLIFISTINPQSSLIQEKLTATFQPNVNVYLSKTNFSSLKEIA